MNRPKSEKPPRVLTPLGAQRKQAAYSKVRAAWRAAHPLGPVAVTEKPK